jgi:mRNA interferase MazF
MPKPKRGELYWVNFDPVRGVEQAGTRPALVVQNDRGNEHSSYTVVCALSTAPVDRPYPFIVLLATGEAGLNRSGHVNCAQIRTIDDSRLEERIGMLSPERMRQVDAALRYELDLEQ